MRKEKQKLAEEKPTPSDKFHEGRGRPKTKGTGFCEEQVLLMFLVNFGEPLKRSEILEKGEKGTGKGFLPLKPGSQTRLNRVIDSLEAKGLIQNKFVEEKNKRGFLIGAEQLPKVIDYCVKFWFSESQETIKAFDFTSDFMSLSSLRMSLQYVKNGAGTPFFARAVKAYLRAESRFLFYKETGKLMPINTEQAKRRVPGGVPEKIYVREISSLLLRAFALAFDADKATEKMVEIDKQIKQIVEELHEKKRYVESGEPFFIKDLLKMKTEDFFQRAREWEEIKVEVEQSAGEYAAFKQVLESDNARVSRFSALILFEESTRGYFMKLLGFKDFEGNGNLRDALDVIEREKETLQTKLEESKGMPKGALDFWRKAGSRNR